MAEDIEFISGACSTMGAHSDCTWRKCECECHYVNRNQQVSDAVLTGQVVLDPIERVLRCETSQCRVTTFRPFSDKARDAKCPACYGVGT